jgi:hypothetical protein
MLRRELVRLISGSILFSASTSVLSGWKKKSNKSGQWECKAIISNWPGRKCLVINGVYNKLDYLVGFVQSFEKDSGVYEIFDNEGKSLKVIVGDLDYMVSVLKVSALDQIVMKNVSRYEN